MTETLFPNQDDVDYPLLANRLLEQGEECSPAAVQGCLCGALIGGAGVDPATAPVVLESALALRVYGELAETSMALYSSLLTTLADEDLSFYPLLPDDEEDIGTRTTALTDWCRAFLAGYTFAASTTQAGSAASPTPDLEEILSDLAAIADAEVDEEAEENETERSYMELVEYLRLAVLNIYAR